MGLEPGDTVAEARRLGLDGLCGRTEIAAAIEQIRNFANPAVKAAKEKSNGEYAVESGSYLTRTREHLLVVVTVTRTE